jgi:hypothetical protein
MRLSMSRRADDDLDDDADDWESDSDDASTIPCPYCQREIYEDSPRCPHCGQYISEDDIPSRPKPWWIILGVLLCLLAMWFWVL